MKLIYSIGTKFAGGGIGTTAYHAVNGLNRHGLLYYVLCGAYTSTEIPENQIRAMGLISRILRKAALLDKSRRMNHLHNQLYDRWAARQLEPCDWFHGWGNYCFSSIKKAKDQGAIISVERASSHPLEQAKLLREEYERWGLTFTIPDVVVEQALAEFDLADYILIPSDFVRDSFLKNSVVAEKLLLIPFGVDIERFHPLPQPESSEKFRAVFVGQVSIRKGVPDLLETWRMLNWQNAELWLIGRISADFQPLLKRYSTLPGVHFLGHTDPVSRLQQADVFVFPTIEEGSALVTYEAMACGLPVVTTHNAGSVVRDGQDGFIVPLRDTASLAERLDHLRSSPKLCQEMSRSARIHVEQFTWDHYGNRLVESIIQRAAAQREAN